mmetsp:Transcript_115249/g.247720  ORF Transcript_115249/g.247720 Transcript_115249/m.247720 type:complete len:612 (+) Transcript_115249:86-1921(+)
MDAAAPASGEGLQYLCAKYSSLITRLREEVLARQTAEADARLLERRAQEEASVFEAERSRSNDEVAALRQRCQRAEAEIELLRHGAEASAHLTARCERLQEACEQEMVKSSGVRHQVVADSEAMRSHGAEMVRLRDEHAELLARHQDTCDELTVCRDHLVRWRRRASELEGQAEETKQGKDEAEARARCLQEEMRQALRKASAARAREAAMVSMAGRGERELRSREERLAAVRREGVRNARRASSAERRLATLESSELAAQRLAQENRDLRARLDSEARACEGARLEAARAEASEARATAGAGEAHGELRTAEAHVAASQQRVADLDRELALARTRLEHLDAERASGGALLEGARRDLQVAQSEREEARGHRDRLASELAESRRRLDRGQPQMAEWRRRLNTAEEALARAQSEAAEEKRAREKCHVETIRATEKLRIARAQGQQLRNRVRALEEVELRYPSRHRWDTMALEVEADGEVDEVAGAIASAAGDWEVQRPPPSPLEALPRSLLPPSPELPAPRPGGTPTAGPADDAAKAVRDFVAQEEQRLAALGGPAASCEELPRAAAPAQARLGAAASDGSDAELAALLAAEPRVLKVPERGPRWSPRAGGA